MMMPSIFGENLFEDWMDFPFDRNFFGNRGATVDKPSQNLMQTDVRESDAGYELAIDLPGFRKEDINAKLENGYLTISATRNKENDEKDEKGKYIRRERYYGSMSRRFYVGSQITQNDIKAKFEDGTLTLTVPKASPALPENDKYIAIEG